MLSDRGIETEKVDIPAYYDRKLTRRENERNMADQFGVGRSASYERAMGEFNDNRQTGSSNYEIDRKRSAQKPGWRKPKGSPGYWERRENRSDVNRKRRI